MDFAKLKRGEPLIIALDELGLHAEIDVALFYGDSEQDLRNLVTEYGEANREPLLPN